MSEAELERLRAENARLKEELQLMQSQMNSSRGATSSAECSACEQQRQQAVADSFPGIIAEHGLTREQVERYSRQILLPRFGIDAQAKLCKSSVLIVGCGGLGAPAALYLAAAGVGRLGLVDHDVVDTSNLHRQVIHNELRLGMQKATSAALTCAALNSHCQLDTHLQGLSAANAVQLVQQYDMVIDASDNPPTRYLISDACAATGRPLVSAAAVGTDGQLTVYCHGEDGPCYRCLFPESPAPENCSRCADAGVLGVVPGVMGVLQALEAIKVITGVGQPLARKLLIFDALSGRFQTVRLRGKAPGCAACSQAASISAASISGYDYEGFTGQAASDGPPPPLKVLSQEARLSPEQLKERLEQQQAGSSCVLLDVRPATQFKVVHLPGAVNIPYDQFDRRFDEVLQLCGGYQGSSGSSGGAAAAAAAAAGTEHSRDGSGGGSGEASSSRTEQQEQRHDQMEQQTKPVYVLCRRGNHSQLAVQRLRAAGITCAMDMVGGMNQWSDQVDPRVPLL